MTPDKLRAAPAKAAHLVSITTSASAICEENNTVSSQTTHEIDAESLEQKAAIKANRIQRFKRQAAARELLPDHRVAWCCRRVGFDVKTRRQHRHVTVKQSAQSGDFYTANLFRCDRWHECYVCWARRTSKYLGELLPLLEKNAGRFAYGMETLTASHHAGMSLADFQRRFAGETDGYGRKIFRGAYDRFRSGRWWQAFKSRWHIRESLTGKDLTHGVNGWHYHIHCLLIADRRGFSVELLDSELFVGRHFTKNISALMWAEAATRWVKCCAAVGLVADLEHGYHIEGGRPDAANYIGKLAMEITKYTNKRGRGGRTLGELLDDYLIGDHRAGQLWIEAQAALAGTHYLTASRGLWALLGRAEPSEAELSAGDESPVDLALVQLSADDWRRIIRAGQRESWFAALADNSLTALAAFCDAAGVSLLPPDTESATPATTEGVTSIASAGVASADCPIAETGGVIAALTHVDLITDEVSTRMVRITWRNLAGYIRRGVGVSPDVVARARIAEYSDTDDRASIASSGDVGRYPSPQLASVDVERESP